ncbi:4Fe-4S dicluster domain-containing protein [Methanotrichaceae archaeon M04Ac]|jgi:heterodisulfide reductase subunit C|uniref:4Fe-4S dicluster domain-containing protein n=1 Tax=Candidatus Methanocrinis alkalitolerans TaxID=3033395 RepID=A0ABT5XHP0_9EURY|nr:4Fe-4S dicluster domain-containing protein [Candidatus Methanocrinis alkalitolerans]MCR3884410.1 4Fe-4S dicluster domain-containing protein [Methanothrix sp.]MDF0594206.1 4Fe-4S dicluster domain-containing protein [Candidatus Methanocrinis alkalitolerans]
MTQIAKMEIAKTQTMTMETKEIATRTRTAEGEKFRERVLALAGSEVKTCIQCGTCSASCPTAHLMDTPIRKLVKLVLEGEKKAALSSRSIWLCTSCLLCTIRCPRSIRPMAVVAALKTVYEKEGKRCRDSVFEGIFGRQIRDYGRISEFLLSAEYMIRSPGSAAQIMAFGAELVPKGKIELGFEAARGERIEGTEEMRRIFELLGDEGKAEAEKVEAAEAGEAKKAGKAEETKEAEK